jgi:hypothetical protein
LALCNRLRYPSRRRPLRGCNTETGAGPDIRPKRPQEQEQWMPRVVRAVLALSFVSVVAACAPKSEPVYVTEPVNSGPTYTGKYK